MQHAKTIFIVVSTFSVCQLNIKSSSPLVVAAVTAARCIDHNISRYCAALVKVSISGILQSDFVYVIMPLGKKRCYMPMMAKRKPRSLTTSGLSSHLCS